MDEPVIVPNFRGRQALDARLSGHDAGLFVQGPDPDSPHPLLNGRVVAQIPAAGTRLTRWGTVTVWITGGGDPAGVREPRRPLPVRRADQEEADRDH
ncbi:PASTA domain-containing protein [Amycolatopsis sp. NBC_01307]|uniref:PASTA domain-containing protein n=1 Tax=Amycolatopsis sp. NBC_01307 TaxID=2903561 RepID=UPI002E151DA0|nr:PASTA domain-containing protein [Amycolatopsis sp. NBC_01307]